MDIYEKLEILTSAAKYDVACTSSGSDRSGQKGTMGSAVGCGICHSFAADGRCISLLKVLMSNACIYDCQYCSNRRSNDVPRATFTADELADLTINFYKRNYIEGLFLSSGVIKNPDYTMEQMIRTVDIIRTKYRFSGYIHAKAIPGADQALIDQMGMLVDRMSVNLELPSEKSLNILAPDKPKSAILKPMGLIRDRITENKYELAVYKKPPKFAPAGQSTQMIIGATPDTDLQIVRLSESLYKKYSLKRVFYSAYVPVGTHALLPRDVPPPLLREHRLYQADWLLRFYGFKADEILDEQCPTLDPFLDPKCNWAVRHLERFPIEINKADISELLRVPGIGTTGAQRIIAARRTTKLNFDHLKKLNIVLKRAVYFITCDGKYHPAVKFDFSFIYQNLTADTRRSPGSGLVPGEVRQMSLFDRHLPTIADNVKSLTGQL